MSDVRLIDANALMKKIAHHTVHDSMSVVTFERANVYELVKGDMFGLVKNAPTIDAVPVVRCRECFYRDKPPCCPYQRSGFKVDPDWYCPMGVKMDGGAADGSD